MPPQLTEHLFSLLLPHLCPSTLALTAASSATLYSPSILALYADLDLSRGIPLPSTILSPEAACAPHLPHVRTLKLPQVMRYNVAMWAGGLGRMKGLRRVVVGSEWDAWPYTGLGEVGLAHGLGGWRGNGNGHVHEDRTEARADEGQDGRSYGVSPEARLKGSGKAEIFSLKASRNGKSFPESDGADRRAVRRRLELEIQGARSPLSALPPGVDKTDILENAESVTLRLENGLPVLRETAAENDDAEDVYREGTAGREGVVGGILNRVDERRSIITALHNHPNIQHLKIILPVHMYTRRPRALEPPMHYRHHSTPSSSPTHNFPAFKQGGAQESSPSGWQHVDLQYDLVHLARNVPARCKLDFIVPTECAGEAWVEDLREAVDEHLSKGRLGNPRWVSGMGGEGCGRGLAKL